MYGLACATTAERVEPALAVASSGESRAILGGKFLTVAPKHSVIKRGDHSLRQVVELGKPPRSALLYFGRFPSHVGGTEKVPGTLLGQPIMWARDPEAPFVLSHLIKLDDGSSLHVILSGESSDGLLVLTQMVQSLRRDSPAK